MFGFIKTKTRNKSINNDGKVPKTTLGNLQSDWSVHMDPLETLHSLPLKPYLLLGWGFGCPTVNMRLYVGLFVV